MIVTLDILVLYRIIILLCHKLRKPCLYFGCSCGVWFSADQLQCQWTSTVKWCWCLCCAQQWHLGERDWDHLQRYWYHCRKYHYYCLYKINIYWEKTFANFATSSHWWNFYHTDFLPHAWNIRLAIFTGYLAKFYIMNIFYNAKVAWLGKILSCENFHVAIWCIRYSNIGATLI